MTRNSIKLPKVNICDLPNYPTKGKLLVNIRGTNGSGKSTIPMSMLSDPHLYLLTWYNNGKVRPFATVFPSFGFVALGTYKNKTGGLDTYKNNEDTRKALELVWRLPYHIIAEGVISSTIKSTYSKLFATLKSKHPEYEREVVVVSLVTPLEVCLERVQNRNGGKPVKSEQIEAKWKIVERNVQYFKDEGYHSIALDNSNLTVEDTLEWFRREVVEVYYVEG